MRYKRKRFRPKPPVVGDVVKLNKKVSRSLTAFTGTEGYRKDRVYTAHTVPITLHNKSTVLGSLCPISDYVCLSQAVAISSFNQEDIFKTRIKGKSDIEKRDPVRCSVKDFINGKENLSEQFYVIGKLNSNIFIILNKLFVGAVKAGAINRLYKIRDLRSKELTELIIPNFPVELNIRKGDLPKILQLLVRTIDDKYSIYKSDIRLVRNFDIMSNRNSSEICDLLELISTRRFTGVDRDMVAVQSAFCFKSALDKHCPDCGRLTSSIPSKHKYEDIYMLNNSSLIHGYENKTEVICGNCGKIYNKTYNEKDIGLTPSSHLFIMSANRRQYLNTTKTLGGLAFTAKSLLLDIVKVMNKNVVSPEYIADEGELPDAPEDEEEYDDEFEPDDEF